MKCRIESFWISRDWADDLPEEAGAKIKNLQTLARKGFTVPTTVFVPQEAYSLFIEKNELLPLVSAFSGNEIDSLRWEEIWDASLALRNAFLKAPVPKEIVSPLLDTISPIIKNNALAVRSCAGSEDSGFSHAGMHDSIIGVNDSRELLKALRIVWASLWSDRAILYRREMGLDPGKSGMGVMIQPMIPGNKSGVMFTQSPVTEHLAIIEAVNGAASEVVDGSTKTEKVEISRHDSRFASFKKLDPPVLTEDMAMAVFRAGIKSEEIFGTAQDIEWTFHNDQLTILQSRPITTLINSGNDTGWEDADKRPWFLSLTRSHDNLLHLRERIEDEVLPQMLAESNKMKIAELNRMECEEIRKELNYRKERLDHWRKVYWRELIPFAHAVRQLGMLYNDALAPDDPFEFTTLLSGQHLLALERNTILEELAALVQSSPKLEKNLREGKIPENSKYSEKLYDFMDKFGDLSCGSSWCDEGPWGIVRLTLNQQVQSSPRPTPPLAHELEDRFLNSFAGKKRQFAESVLDLARSSYRLRDDDNIYLGRIQARYDEALTHACQKGIVSQDEQPEARKTMPKGLAWEDSSETALNRPALRGWAASAGVARGPAKVIHGPDNLFEFQKGEIMVCDALDPNMTFVVPLASAIVERRGGMLVHGAIIAREYGIPCVTGIPDATRFIKDGDNIIVDGFRGTVEFDREKPK